LRAVELGKPGKNDALLASRLVRDLTSITVAGFLATGRV